MTVEAVNKLLIQNNDTITSIPKEALVLKEMEERLNNHPMVQNAHVFMTIGGEIGAEIEQRIPIGRVVNSTSFYIDEKGEKMPLSSVHSVRVPLVVVQPNTDFSELVPILTAIQEDEFMKSMVVGLRMQSNGEVVLKLRKHDFEVQFGKIEGIAKKIQNFKAFLKKAKKDKTLSAYRSVNLAFGSQVVATKK